MNLLTRLFPRIHTDNAHHDWTFYDQPTPHISLYNQRRAYCTRCEQRPLVSFDDEQFLRHHATGCAGHHFTGLYRPGDHLDADNMRYVFVRYDGWNTILVHPYPRPHQLLSFPRTAARPVLAGAAQAEKRRQLYLERTP